MNVEASFSWLRIDPEHARFFDLNPARATYQLRHEIQEWFFDQGWRRKDHYEYGIRLSEGASMIMHELYIDFKKVDYAAQFKLRWM